MAFADFTVKNSDDTPITQQDAKLLDETLNIFGAMANCPRRDEYAINPDGTCQARILKYNESTEQIIRSAINEKGFEIVNLTVTA